MKGKVNFNIKVKDYYSSIKIDDVEIWKVINDFPNYIISNYGRAKRIISRHTNYINKLVPASLNGFGYYTVSLHKGHKTYRFSIHKLVAIHFLDNPNKYNIVNHKDENKLNNKVDNLEWCDIKYNVLYSNNNIKASIARSNPIKMIDNNGIESIYKSISECARKNNLDATAISKRINNIANCYSNYKFILI